MDFLQLRFLGPLKWREPHKSPKVVDFVQSAPFPEAISKAPVDFLDFRLLGPPKWREPHKSPKFVDFVESAPFPEAIFQGSCGFPATPASGTAEMEGTPQKPKSCRFCILEKGPSEIGQECAPNPLTWQNPASISRIQPLRGKPSRSLCVAPLKEELWESMWPFSGGHILEKGPPRDQPRMCSKPFIL